MATVYPLVPRQSVDRSTGLTLFRGQDEDDVATLSLIARQFGDAAGADGTALILQSSEGEPERVLSVDGACMAAGMPPMPNSSDSRTELTGLTAGTSWILQRFQISRDGATHLLLATFFKRARSSARAIGEAELRFRPIIEGVAQIWGSAHAARRRMAGYAAALNHADMGVVLLDREADILFANDAANTLLDTGTGIRRRRNSLVAADLNDAVKLQMAINHVIDRDPPGTRGARTPLVALKGAKGARPLLVSVLPPGQVSASPRDVAAILYLCDPELDLKPLMQGACRFYRLSPVETRLASTLAGGCTLAEAAAELHIKEQTARSYLKQIFIKTGTRRQGELIRVLLTSVSRTSQSAEFDVV